MVQPSLGTEEVTLLELSVELVPPIEDTSSVDEVSSLEEVVTIEELLTVVEELLTVVEEETEELSPGTTISGVTFS